MRRNVLLLFVLIAVCVIVACNSNNSVPPVLKTVDMSGIKFVDKTVEYNGAAQEITISGELPDGVKVIYENNTLTEPGKVEAVAKFKVPDGYNQVDDMVAVLTVTKGKIVLDGIQFRNDTYGYDGTEHSIFIRGELPEGYSVEYKGNSATKVGNYKAEAYISNGLYESILNAELTIDSRTVHRISNYEELVSELSDFAGKTQKTDLYVLVDNIDASKTSKTNPWKSIGAYAGLKYDNGFQAEFNGQGYSIKNLYITQDSDTQKVTGYHTPGFFGGLAYASVHDLVFDSPTIDIAQYGIVNAGLIIGQSPVFTDIYNITVNDMKMTVIALKQECGALIGYDQQYGEKDQYTEAVNNGTHREFRRDNLCVNNLVYKATKAGANETDRIECSGIIGTFVDRGPATYSNCSVTGTIEATTNGNPKAPLYSGSIIALVKNNTDQKVSLKLQNCKTSLDFEISGYKDNVFAKDLIGSYKSDWVDVSQEECYFDGSLEINEIVE